MKKLICLLLLLPLLSCAQGVSVRATNGIVYGLPFGGISRLISTNGTNSLVVGNPHRGDGISQIHLRDGALWMPEFLSWGYYPASGNEFAGGINWYAAGGKPGEDGTGTSGGAPFAKLASTLHWGGAAYEPWSILTCLNVRLEEGWQNYQLKNPSVHLGNEDNYGSLVINYTQPWDMNRNMVNGGVGRGRPLVFAARGRDGSGNIRAEPGIQSRPAGRVYSRTDAATGTESFAGELYFHSLVPMPTTNGATVGGSGTGQDQATAWNTQPGRTNAIMHVDWWEWFKDMRVTSGTNSIFVAATNSAYFGPYNALYPDIGGIIIGTNMIDYMPGSGNGAIGDANSKGNILMPNGSSIGDRWGNRVWFIPSHNMENSSAPTTPVMVLQGGKDIDLLPGRNGTAQLGVSGNSFNQNINIQYNDRTRGYSHLFGFQTINDTVSRSGNAGILGITSLANGYADLHFFTKKPIFSQWPSTADITDWGQLVMSLDTDTSATGTGVRFNKRVSYARITSSGSTIPVNFGSEYLQDVVATATTLTITFANQRPGNTNLTKKLFYLRSAELTVSSITWPSGITVVSEGGAATALPTSLAADKILRVEFESIGNAAADVLARYSVGTDNWFTYDTDAQSFFTAATITDPLQKVAVNQLVLDLKADNLWTKMQALYPFVGGNATAHSYNLKNTAQFQITWTGAGVTHDANGITGNGSTAYGNTGYTPSTSGSLNSQHLAVYNRTTAPTDSGFMLGGNKSDGADRLEITRNGAGMAANVNDPVGTCDYGMSTDLRGFLAASRISSTQVLLENRLNTGDYGCTVSSSALPNASVYVLCRNYGGANAFTTANLALASIGSGLTQAELRSFETAVNSFQTSLGRNVP